MKGKMTTSRIGIMGSFRDSNFSLDVVTDSPGRKKQALTGQFTRNGALFSRALLDVFGNVSCSQGAGSERGKSRAHTAF
jgi:hypothetical protein